jgi:hypothetical protein
VIAMQYGFVLPADYDMAIIDERIRTKGPMLDGFPLLHFKAYLSARKNDAGFTSIENLYAPFYLWDAPGGLDGFLSGPGFATLTRDFGWPMVRTWMVWHAEIGSGLRNARYASRRITPITAYSDLAAQRDIACADARSTVQYGALATVVGFDPTGWTQVQFCLWLTPPAPPEADTQVYAVGHVSLPAVG